MAARVPLLAALASLLLLQGCDGRVLDPEKNPLTWNIEGTNNQNIATMVADPRDLAHGHGDSLGDGGELATAIQRWRAAPPDAAAGVSATSGAGTSGATSGSPGGSGGGP